MRKCPDWFQRHLTAIGGTNPYGEPIFKLVWSHEPRIVSGGRWADGKAEYRQTQMMRGEPCWALMVWEPRETHGPPWRWEMDYRDAETGLLQCGAYPKHGRYRLLQRFIHQELIEQEEERHYMDGNIPRTELIGTRKVETSKLEPTGILLDMLIPMLIAWRRLGDYEKLKALKQQEKLEAERMVKLTRDAMDDVKLSRVMRGSKLVQDKAELIERSMRQAVAMASRYGLGITVEAA